MKNHTDGPADPEKPVKSEETGPVCDAAHPVVCTRAAMRILTGKWKGEIMWNLKDGKRRFGELQRAIPGITQHMLTAQLRDLESHGLITRTVYAEVPPRVEYELTRAALDLHFIFEGIREWAERYATELNLTAEEEEIERLVEPAGPGRRAPKRG